MQGTEIQLGLAVECPKATMSVKRRLACEQLSYFSQVCNSTLSMKYVFFLSLVKNIT